MIDGQELEDREWDVMFEKMASEVGLVLENIDDVDDPAASPSGGVSNSEPATSSQHQRSTESGHSGGAGFRAGFASETDVKSADLPGPLHSQFELPSYEADDLKFYDRVYDTIVADEQQLQQQQLVQQQLQQSDLQLFVKGN